MDKRTIQHPIDFHFQRNVKLRTGEVVLNVMASKVETNKLFECEVAGCSTKCINKGALATHVKYAHPTVQKTTLATFVVVKKKICNSAENFSVSHDVVRPFSLVHFSFESPSSTHLSPFGTQTTRYRTEGRWSKAEQRPR